MTSVPAIEVQAAVTGKAAYTSYRPCEQTWLPDIPAHWRLKRIKHEYAVTLGKMLQSSPASARDLLLPYLRSANVTWDGVDISDVKEMYFSPSEAARHRLTLDDVVVCEGGDVGRAAVWGAQLPEVYIQNAVHRVRTKGRSVNRFLYYWLFMAKESGIIDVLVDRATIGHLTEEKLREVPFFCPPRVEQEQMVSFLDRETAKIDALVARRERLIELLEEKRAALISQAVTKGLVRNVPMKDSGIPWLGKIPAHWPVMPLKRYVVSMCDGPFGSDMKSAHYSDGGVRLIRLQNIGLGKFDGADAAYISESHFSSLPGHDAIPGDLLVAGLGDANHPVGRACIVPASVGKAMVKADSFRVRLNEARLLHRFAMYFLCSTAARAAVATRMRGATRDRMNLAGLGELPAFVPPVEEQRAIVSFLDDATGKFGCAVWKCQEAIERLQEYRTALIAAAVTGKIDVRGEAQ